MLFSTLLTVLPQLLFMVALGYVAGRYLNIPLEAVAKLALYLIVPIGSFGAVARLDLTPATFGLPLAGLVLASAASYIAYYASRMSYRDNHRNLIAMASTTGNTGYFGIPVVLALYGPDMLGLYFLTTAGIIFAEVTIGYYFGNRGHLDVKASLIRVAKLPIVYGILAGVAWAATGAELPAPIYSLWEKFIAAYTVIGMMIVGIAIGQSKTFEWDGKLFAWLWGVKFVVWPVLAAIMLGLGLAPFMAHLSPHLPLLFILMAAVPLAGNTPAYAAMTGLHPEKAALATLISTLVSIVTLPATLWLAQHYLL